MKFLCFVICLGLLGGEAAFAEEISYCEKPPEGSYKKRCTDIRIRLEKDEFGVSKCVLKARCKTPPATRQKTVLTTLRMDEGNFGPHSPCTDISVADNGHLQCVTQRGSLPGF